jgi:shikimate kinase/3-dehydroquinate synthase
VPEAGAGVVLIGLPGSGKSTVGRLVAERLGRRFVDTDELFERLHGEPVPSYLAREGEPAFRQLEAVAVQEALADPEAVIGVGGGAVLDPLNRWALWHHGTVAWLDAPPARLVERLAGDPTPRPTIQPYDPDRLASTLDQRAPMYRGADLRLDAGEEPEAVATALLARLSPRPGGRRLFDAEVPRQHPVGPATTRVILGTDLDRAAFTDIAGTDASVIVDRRVASLHPALVASAGTERVLAVPGGERAKRMRLLERILEWLAGQRAERGSAVVAIGGGTTGDLAGTAAALYARGVPLVQVPTTWLAMADSAIGGKVAVDLAAAKNAVGAFWPPVAVIGDVAALRTLPPADLRDGMAESVKSALIGDPALWALIEERGAAALRNDEPARYAIVERSARLKLDVCARDPFEAGERRILNLGHTVGHALEIASRYRLRHGAAVVVGMRAVAAIAAGRGADPELAPRLDELLHRLGFRLTVPFDPAAVRRAMLGDKKRKAGRQRWILPMEIGRVIEVDDVANAELDRALRTIHADGPDR